jgi:hypothetical protein
MFSCISISNVSIHIASLSTMKLEPTTTDLTIEVVDSRRLKVDFNASNITPPSACQEFPDPTLSGRTLLDNRNQNKTLVIMSKPCPLCHLRTIDCNVQAQKERAEHTSSFDSILSCSTLLNSCTSRCRDKSACFHPNDFVNPSVAVESG